jgi:hypothetical protein
MAPYAEGGLSAFRLTERWTAQNTTAHTRKNENAQLAGSLPHFNSHDLK